MPEVSTGTKVTVHNLEDRLKQGVPIPKMGNLKGISHGALEKIYEGHLKGDIVFKVDTQYRLLAYPKGYTPKRGRPRKNPESETEQSPTE